MLKAMFTPAPLPLQTRYSHGKFQNQSQIGCKKSSSSIQGFFQRITSEKARGGSRTKRFAGPKVLAVLPQGKKNKSTKKSHATIIFSLEFLEDPEGSP